MLPKYEIFADKQLTFTIRYFTWMLPHDHDIYKNYQKSFKNITLSNLVKLVMQYEICCGLSLSTSFQNVFYQYHNIPLTLKSISNLPLGPLSQSSCIRSNNCLIFVKSSSLCIFCEKQHNKDQKSMKRKANISSLPVKANAPISLTSPSRLKATIQSFRIENKQLKIELQKMSDEIAKYSVQIGHNLSNDLVTIMANTDKEQISPFMKMFWEEQQKYLSQPKQSVRYHPMVIRYCLGLASKSPSVYNAIRYDEKSGTGFLILPSQRRLRDYKNYIRPQQGFNRDIILELINKTKDFSDIERYMVLLFDEMKIQDSLVWDKHTGELIGFVNLGDTELNYATLQKVDEIATHMLVFYLRGVVNPFKFSLANFATTGASSIQLFPLFWKAVGICETKCKLKLIAVTCDGASPNRKLFKMHLIMEEEKDENNKVCYRTKNLYSDDRYIYFIADSPHLLKTLRNCLYQSGRTRYMWNKGMHLTWNHIKDIFYEDRESALHLLPKLTKSHIELTPFSKMNVRLAAQVLSLSVGNILKEYGPEEASATSQYCLLIDKFFDITNIRSIHESKYSLKSYRAPFKHVNDERFTWLKDEFLVYFEQWLLSIKTRPGNFSQKERNNMFISQQSYEGILITVNSLIEVIQFLLNNNVPYVLTERFSQDPLENYFGYQRSSCSRRDNPTIHDFGYNDNAIRNQKVFLPIAGSNSTSNEKPDVLINCDPVPCRKKKKVNSLLSK